MFARCNHDGLADRIGEAVSAQLHRGDGRFCKEPAPPGGGLPMAVGNLHGDGRGDTVSTGGMWV